MFKYVLIATLIAQVVLLYGIFIIPGLVSLGTAYSYVSGFGVLLVAIALTGLFLESWQAVAAFFVAKFAAAILGFVLELWEMRRIHRSSEIAFTASERAFVNAYRLHASRLGVSTDIDVPECEIESGKWRDALGRFAYEYPAVVQRFAI
ncbi:MAG TPA: hypothetical protein VFZ20_32200 [Longimicrobium sp.]|nr:hypothetical protein [Longimicrobium sp.]